MPLPFQPNSRSPEIAALMAAMQNGDLGSTGQGAYVGDDTSGLIANQTPVMPHTHSILEEDPGTFGAGRDDLYEKYSKAAALKGLQNGLTMQQQKIDANDPTLARQKASLDDNYEFGLNGNIGGDVQAQHRAAKAADIESAGVAKNDVDLDALRRVFKEKNLLSSEAEMYSGHQEALDKQLGRDLTKAEVVAGNKPYDVNTSRTLNTLENAKTLGARVLGTLDQMGVVGDEYQNLSFLKKLPMVGYSNLTNYMYSKGIPVDKMNDDLNQLTALLQANQIAGLSVGGRPSIQWIKLLQQHLADGTQPPGEIKARVEQIMSLIPEFERNAMNARRPGAINPDAIPGQQPKGFDFSNPKF